MRDDECNKCRNVVGVSYESPVCRCDSTEYGYWRYIGRSLFLSRTILASSGGTFLNLYLSLAHVHFVHITYESSSHYHTYIHFARSQCADDPEGFDCDNPERESPDLVITKVDLSINPKFTTYSACNLCNGTDPFTHKECDEGSYVCDCMASASECISTNIGKENISSFFVPKPETSKCYQDMESHCGELKNKGRICSACVYQFVNSKEGECSWVDTSNFCTTAPCNKDAKDWICWHNNMPRKTGGFWYSTLEPGMCSGKDDDENCTWTVKRTTTVNESCVRSRIETYMEKQDTNCFESCSSPRNVSDSCWIGCFMDVLMGKDARNNDTIKLGGLDIQDLVDVWENSFQDETQGGCPRISMRNQVNDDDSDYSLIPPHKSFELNPLCYDCNNDTYASYVLKHDPLVRNHVKVNGSCVQNGFTKYVRNDPLYKDAKLYRK